MKVRGKISATGKEKFRRERRRVRQNFENDKKIEQKRKLKIRNDKKFKK
jgi:hypothetical protein